MSSVGRVVPGTNLVTREDSEVGYVRDRIYDVSDWSVLYDSGWQEEDEYGDAVAMGISYEMGEWVARAKNIIVFGDEWRPWHSPDGLVMIDWENDQAILQKKDGSVKVGTCADLDVPEVLKTENIEDFLKEMGL